MASKRVLVIYGKEQSDLHFTMESNGALTMEIRDGVSQRGETIMIAGRDTDELIRWILEEHASRPREFLMCADPDDCDQPMFGNCDGCPFPEG